MEPVRWLLLLPPPPLLLLLTLPSESSDDAIGGDMRLKEIQEQLHVSAAACCDM